MVNHEEEECDKNIQKTGRINSKDEESKKS